MIVPFLVTFPSLRKVQSALNAPQHASQKLKPVIPPLFSVPQEKEREREALFLLSFPFHLLNIVLCRN